jgi:hypothetical protein
MVYLSAADCELYPFDPSSTIHAYAFNFSGDDPASICNVESIEKDSVSSPAHLHSRDLRHVCRGRHLLQ